MAGADFAKQVQMLVYAWQNASKRKAGGQAGFLLMEQWSKPSRWRKVEKRLFFFLNIHRYTN